MKIAIEDTTTVNKASGDIVSFEATSVQPLQSLTVHVEPIQDLHGYDNPWPEGGGKNLLNVKNAKSKTENNITWTINADESISVSGSTTGQTDLYFCGASGVYNSFGLPTGAYTFTIYSDNATPSSGFQWFLVKNGGTVVFGGNLISTQVSQQVSITDTETYRFFLRVTKGTAVNKKLHLQIESGSSPTAWTPYSNICPISGWDAVGIERTGFNVWDEETVGGWISTTGSISSSTDAWVSKNYISVKPSAIYYSVNPNTGTAIRKVEYDANKNLIEGSVGWMVGQYTPSANARYIKIAQYLPQYGHDVSINYPSTDHAYHAYSGTTYTITLGQTVYGGTLDAVNGVLTVAKAIVDLGTFGWSKSSGTYGGFYATNAFYYRWASDTKMLCSRYKFDGVRVSASYFGDNGTLTCYFGSAQPVFEIYIKDESLADKTASEFQTEMSGVQLVYELATPITIQLDPVTISTISGQTNNLWCDAGEIDVEWRGTWKDITGWIAWQGLDFSRNDIDASDAGRDINGKMQRGRIAIKEKMTVRTVQLDQNDIATVHALCEPSQFNVRVNPYPRTNSEKVMTMYTNNVKTDYVIHRENGNDLQELSFPLIEI